MAQAQPVTMPAPRRARSGEVARLAGPFTSAAAYCEAFLRAAPPDQAMNRNITLRSACAPIGAPTSDERASPAPLPEAPPFGAVGLIRTSVPRETDGRWNDFQEVRVFVTTDAGVFVEERGIELAAWLPESIVTLETATAELLVGSRPPELRVRLELFVGADEGVPEQYQRIELVCGTGRSGALACGRFASRFGRARRPGWPATAARVRRLRFP